ncbi:MAG: ABC transporter permease subunit, partial [Oscillospiraceae bacterium]|nr:ABC transporter permease subunit [Oscillospiraceae bacterium]
YLMSNSHMWLKMMAWGLWKGVGWSAIIYIAAISGIDQGLYEAATVDGAGRFAKMWYITVPELIPTYCVLLLMSIANILSNGMEQYYVFENSNNYEHIQVLDLYVYNLGIDKGLIPLSTVIGMVKSVVSVFLLFMANGVSKAVRGESIV